MSFGAIADDYDRLRTGPPEAAVDWLLPGHCQVAVDLGAGTGLLTRALARKVAHVIAVEPDERMRAVLRARSPGVEVVEGRAEAIPVGDASAEGVFVSSAWHWMDPELAVPEITRVLRDGGRFGLVWTSRDHEAREFRELIRLAWPGELRGQETTAREAAGAPAGIRSPSGNHVVTLPEGAQLHNVATESFRFMRRMAKDDVVDQLATFSRVITASPGDREAFLGRARTALAELFPGATEIDVPMQAWCWRADRLDRASRGTA
jgi:SAM-dependent methyltransferase